MNQHPNLRAYMAGITIPTALLFVGMIAFTLARYAWNIPVPIERVVVFPMAVVPNAWGLWNILYTSKLARRRFPIGAWGALLPFLLVPLAYAGARLINFPIPHFIRAGAPIFFPLSVVIYYLFWKFAVARLNAILSTDR
jgi:hypothetical protein